MSAGGAPGETVLLDAAGIAALLGRFTEALAVGFGAADDLCLVGIKRRGDVLARRLQASLAVRLGRELPLGSLDITLYRDDFDSLAEEPVVGTTEIPFALDRRTVILVDDVLFTGRTVRAALDELLNLGRPARVALVVLIDRGWRELPIAADLAGLTVATARDDDVAVALAETDDEERAVLRRGARPGD
ncbi:MAG TPA: bifunctional pyr operon transcriptional regulator/uracil phosphoribosyltransferase PyrR [Thermomicrobiales bacterium]|nr:bifunctional pyr operon transcriptional regulator/uracil phosphoribosyltransferase PyrR [Thermomicrobiales bacterium]